MTGLLILTVTCTYPRSAVSFIFLPPLGDTFASKELNPTSNVGNFYRKKKKKSIPEQCVKNAGIHFTESS